MQLTSVIIRKILYLKKEREVDLVFEVVEDIEAVRIKSKIIGLQLEDITEGSVAIIESNGSAIRVLCDKEIKVLDGEPLFMTPYVRYNATKLDFGTIDIRALDFSEVKIADNMFYGIRCKELIVGNLSNCKLRSIREMFHMFKADRLDLSGINIENITQATGAFAGANIKELILPNKAWEELSKVGGMFSSSNIKKIEPEYLDMPAVESILGLFFNAETVGLKGIKLNKVHELIGVITGTDNIDEFSIEVNQLLHDKAAVVYNIGIRKLNISIKDYARSLIIEKCSIERLEIDGASKIENLDIKDNVGQVVKIN